MYYVAVTIRIEPCNKEVDIDLPWLLPLPEFLMSEGGLEAVIRRKLPECADRVISMRVQSRGQWQIGRSIRDKFVPLYTHTLQGAGVYDGDHLIVRVRTFSRDVYRYYFEIKQEGHYNSERVYLMDDEMIVGRSIPGENGPMVQVDVTTLSPNMARFVSRRHLRIKRKDGGIYVQDLGSQNGTTLNGVPLQSTKGHPSRWYRVYNGDEIVIGKRLVFQFHDKGTNDVKGLRTQGDELT